MANSQFSVAVHIMTLLATACRNLTSDSIARSVNTNPVVIRRLLSQLGRAGLVASQTGAAGGTRLTRGSSEITLCEIYKAVSGGEVFALHGRAPNQDCPVGRNIEAVLCRLQKEIDRTVADTLSQRDLQSVVDLMSISHTP